METLDELVRKSRRNPTARSRQLIPILSLVWSYNDYMRRGKVYYALRDYENIQQAITIALHQEAITEDEVYQIYRQLEVDPDAAVESLHLLDAEDADASGSDS